MASVEDYYRMHLTRPYVRAWFKRVARESGIAGPFIGKVKIESSARAPDRVIPGVTVYLQSKPRVIPGLHFVIRGGRVIPKPAGLDYSKLTGPKSEHQIRAEMRAMLDKMKREGTFDPSPSGPLWPPTPDEKPIKPGATTPSTTNGTSDKISPSGNLRHKGAAESAAPNAVSPTGQFSD